MTMRWPSTWPTRSFERVMGFLAELQAEGTEVVFAALSWPASAVHLDLMRRDQTVD